MKPHRDVLIVGAGPAGLSTAIEYLENGGKGRVTILEALRRPNRLEPGMPGAGHSMCSGGLGKYMMDLVAGDPPSDTWRIPQSVIMAPIKRAVLRGPTERAEIDGSLVGLEGQPVGVVMDRKKLDDWLLGRAVKLGAEYRQGFRVHHIYGGSRWDVFDDVEKIQDANGGFLVGADGPESLVAKEVFHAPPVRDDDMFLGSEVYVKAPSFAADQVELFFQPSRLLGYYWCFGAGDGVVKVGCGTTRASAKNGINGRGPVNPAAETGWWCGVKAQESNDQGYIEGFRHPLERIGGRITGAAPLPDVVRGNAALVGEAARAVWASIGAGDASAIESGRALGRALSHGDPSEYQRYWDQHMRKFLRRHWRIKNALLQMSDRQIDRAIRLIAGHRPRSTNTRTEIPRLMAYLLRKDPGLLGWAAVKAMMP